MPVTSASADIASMSSRSVKPRRRLVIALAGKHPQAVEPVALRPATVLPGDRDEDVVEAMGRLDAERLLVGRLDPAGHPGGHPLLRRPLDVLPHVVDEALGRSG